MSGFRIHHSSIDPKDFMLEGELCPILRAVMPLAQGGRHYTQFIHAFQGPVQAWVYHMNFYESLGRPAVALLRGKWVRSAQLDDPIDPASGLSWQWNFEPQAGDYSSYLLESPHQWLLLRNHHGCIGRPDLFNCGEQEEALSHLRVVEGMRENMMFDCPAYPLHSAAHLH